MPPPRDTKSFWTCAIITAISSLVSSGFSLSYLTGMHIYNMSAWYAASRSAAIPLAVLVFIAVRSRGGILALALVMAFIQALDGVIGIFLHDSIKTFGPLTLALIGFISVGWLGLTREA
jgi:hypothetical protein